MGEAYRLNPLPPLWYSEMDGNVSFVEGQYEVVVPAFEPMQEGAWDMMYVLSGCGHLGLKDKARTCLAGLQETGRTLDFLAAARAERYRDSEPRERLIAGLEKALAYCP